MFREPETAGAPGVSGPSRQGASSGAQTVLWGWFNIGFDCSVSFGIEDCVCVAKILYYVMIDWI